MSGHVGPAERALRLPPDADWWLRSVGFVGLIGILVGWFKFLWTSDWRRWGWLGVQIVSIIVVLAVGGLGRASYAFAMVVDVAFALAVILTGTSIFVGAKANIGACALAFALVAALNISIAGTAAHSSTVTFLIALVSAFLVAMVVAAIIALLLSRSAIRNRLRWFLLAWTAILFVVALTSPAMLAHLSSWSSAGALLLFTVLLTVVNAPFDWVALGLTRGLLRRGLERGGWMPVFYGLADLVAAVVAIFFLSVATLWSVQLFEHVTVLGGGQPILVADRVLAALADPSRRSAPEYWWLYAMLFSTLIPSIANAMLGTLSLFRGLPGLHAYLGKKMPGDGAILDIDREWMAFLLGFQLVFCTALGLALFPILIWAILTLEIPIVGLSLVPMLQAIETADVPGKLLNAAGVG